jgi:hypothetical protein
MRFTLMGRLVCVPISSFLFVFQLAAAMSLGALNATLEGAGAIVGALMIGFFVLDGNNFRRRTRGFLGLAFVSTMTIVVWSCALAWQVKFDRTPRDKLHYTNKAYRGKGALFFFCMSLLPLEPPVSLFLLTNDI